MICGNLIKMKLQHPIPSRNLVSRPALYRALEKGLHRKLILVSAPAGNGKTTLIASWISQNDHPSPAGVPFFLFSPHYVQALILITIGNLDDVRAAIEILDHYLTYSSSNHYQGLTLKATALQALAYEALGKTQKALDRHDPVCTAGQL